MQTAKQSSCNGVKRIFSDEMGVFCTFRGFQRRFLQQKGARHAENVFLSHLLQHCNKRLIPLSYNALHVAAMWQQKSCCHTAATRKMLNLSTLSHVVAVWQQNRGKTFFLGKTHKTAGLKPLRSLKNGSVPLFLPFSSPTPSRHLQSQSERFHLIAVAIISTYAMLHVASAHAKRRIRPCDTSHPPMPHVAPPLPKHR